MDTSLIISGISLVVAIVSATLAYVSVREQQRLSTNITSFSQLASAELLMEKNSDLLKLHNVDPQVLLDNEVTPSELVYVVQSFSAAEFYHRLGRDSVVTLTDYRKNLLKNHKVQMIWKKFVQGRFVACGPFSEAVDDFISNQRSETSSSQPPQS